MDCQVKIPIVLNPNRKRLIIPKSNLRKVLNAPNEEIGVSDMLTSNVERNVAFIDYVECKDNFDFSGLLETISLPNKLEGARIVKALFVGPSFLDYLHKLEFFDNNPETIFIANRKGLSLFLLSEGDQALNDIYYDFYETIYRGEDFHFSLPNVPYYINIRHNNNIHLVISHSWKKYGKDYCSHKKVRHRKYMQYYIECNRMLSEKGTIYSKGDLVEQCTSKGFPRIPCGSIDYSESNCMVSMEIFYNKTSGLSNTGIVEIENSNDMSNAKEVLLANNINIIPDYEEFGREVNNNKIYVNNIPNHVISDSYLKWYIGGILSANNIGYKTISFKRFNKRNDPTFSVKYMILCRLLEGATKLNIWNGPKFQLHDHVTINNLLKNEREHPWLIEKVLPHKVHQDFEEGYNIQFLGSNVTMGIKLINYFMNNVKENPSFLYFGENENFGAEIVPNYVLQFGLSHKLRYAYREEINAFDEQLKNYLREICRTQIETPMTFTSIRLFETYDEENNECIFGVEGWNKKIVISNFEKIRNMLLKSFTLDCTEKTELLYGIGLSYVRSLVSKLLYRIVVDVDKTNCKITIYGPMAEEAIKMINKFYEEMPTRNIATEVFIGAPRYSSLCFDYFKFVEGTMKYHADFITIVNEEAKTILFEGTVKLYNDFLSFLDDLNEKILKLFVDGVNLSYTIPKCPICLNEISLRSFRLERCGHSYCYECITATIKNAVELSRFPIECLYEDCVEFIDTIDVKSILIGDMRRVKYLDGAKLKKAVTQSLNNIVSSNVYLRFCDNLDCSGIINRDANSSKLECKVCHKMFCNMCLLEPHSGSCERYLELRNDVDLSLEAFSGEMGPSKIKKCPTSYCQAVIIKDEGCNHVQCIFCQYHFCWLCLFSSNESGKLYAHMNEIHGGAGGLDDNFRRLFNL